MLNTSSNPIPDLIASLDKSLKGEIRTDPVSRVLYSTDASIYQVEPHGVFFPRHAEEISLFVEAAHKFDVAIIPRGSGSSLAGQAIGPGFIIDCSRYLNQIVEINPENLSAIIEPGLVLSELNRAASEHQLKFGPDPASEERATLGGVIANNATGAHSIIHGMAADHVLSLDVTLSDGSGAHFSEIELGQAQGLARTSSREGEIYRSALSIREHYHQEIISSWPKTWRRASGYNLNYLIPWSPSIPPQWMENTGADHGYPPLNPGSINLAPVIAGSEGTLGIIRQAMVRLVHKPGFSSLVLLAFEDLVSACDQVPNLLDLKPSAIELIPSNMLKLARNIPAYAKQITIMNDLVSPDNEFPNLLVVEFSSDSPGAPRHLCEKVAALIQMPYLIAEEQALQDQIWNVRKVGLGILMSIPGDLKPIPFVEDISVPVAQLGRFVAEFQKIMQHYDTRGDFYAHASAGCLHIRPLINLKQPEGVQNMRAVGAAAIELISSLGGTPSGEHGDGIARSEWLEGVFGSSIFQAFQELKCAADPKGLLNPGKIVDPLRMDENLRYGRGTGDEIETSMLDFSGQAGFAGAIDMCNGAGVCRKSDGLMCPSFQATREETHSTRGRANLLRALLDQSTEIRKSISEEDVYLALDLCLACKGCKSECPSAVDMAKIKYEFLDHYYQPGSGHRHPLRDNLFAYIGELSQIGSFVRPAANFLLRSERLMKIRESWLGISGNRTMPLLKDKRFLTSQVHSNSAQSAAGDSTYENVIFLVDPFTEYYQPHVGTAAWKLLVSAGCHIKLLPVSGAGRTKISKGFLKPAKDQAKKLISSVNQLDPTGEMPIIGVEPSEIYTLKDEYPDFFPGERVVKSMAARAYMIDEFLIRHGAGGQARVLRIDNIITNNSKDHRKVYLHGHCYQKSQPPADDGYPLGVQATKLLLEMVGYRVELIDAGCCGMAGAFGYEAEHYDVSMAIGELALFPQVRNADADSRIAASGFSCLSQIKDGTGRSASHFVSLVDECIDHEGERAK